MSISNNPARWVILALTIAMGFFAVTTIANAGPSDRPSAGITGFEAVAVVPNQVDFDPGNRNTPTVVFFHGSGFAPGAELSLLLRDQNGVLTDITPMTFDAPSGGGTSSVFPLVANDDGAWGTSWTVGRFSRNGIGGEGSFSLWVVDQDLQTIASGPIALCNLTNRPDGDPVPSECAS